MSKLARRAAVLVSGLALAQGAVSVAAQDATASIKRDSEAAKRLDEPSFQTREERLKSKPLDWNTTIGKPKRKAMTAAERKALEGAKPESHEGGQPNPKADEEARKMHPEEWKDQK